MISEQIISSSFDRLRKQKIFLTGGTGFFGKSFLDLLLKQKELNDFDITILSRNPEVFLQQEPKFNKSFLKFTKGRIEDFAFPQTSIDLILHFATPADAKMNLEAPLAMFDTIYLGMKRVLDFAVYAKAKKLLFTSSGAVYGPQPFDISHVPEDYKGAPSTTAIGSAYGEGKRISELLGCEHARKFGYDFKIARCFAFMGKRLNRDGSFAIGNFINDTLKGRDIDIKGDGTPLRSYLYSDDLIVWLIKILFDGKNCEPYNVGSDQSISISDLAKAVQKTLSSDRSIQIRIQPNPNQSPLRYVPSIRKAKQELQLEVWTSLDEGILLSSKN